MDDLKPERRPHTWRPSCPAHKRGYGWKHKRIKRDLFRDEPNCRECASAGKVVKATHADHIKPLCLGGITERENYQPLCEPHSRSKAGREGAHMRWYVRRGHMDRGDSGLQAKHPKGRKA